MEEAGDPTPYILRPLVQDIPLSTEVSSEDVHITCVELCGDNLYVGTSQAEILHFVSIAPDPSDESQAPSYIFASRLQPTYNDHNSPKPPTGVQQILVLPKDQKACVLCNGTLSFYTLPELSPAFGNTSVANCTHVGGLDLNIAASDGEYGTVVMICVKNKVRLARIGDEVRRVRDIQFPGCLASARRGEYACMADAHGYALLDVENQRKISLFPISSLDDNQATGEVEDVSATQATPVRPASAAREVSRQGGHGRSTSLNTLVGNIGGRRQASPRSSSRDRSGFLTPEPFLEETPVLRSPSHARTESTAEGESPPPATPDKPLPITPRSDSLRPPRAHEVLRPFICSPISSEFLLTTGTSAKESGVGMFVTVDGDVVRGTIEFSRYPTSIVTDGATSPAATHNGSQESKEGFVIATMSRSINGIEKAGIEIQRWDVEDSSKKWLDIPTSDGGKTSPDEKVEPKPLGCGVRVVETPISSANQEVGALLRAGMLRLAGGETHSEGSETVDATKSKEEAAFGRRLGVQTTNIILWSGSSVWSLSRSALVTRLDAALNQAITMSNDHELSEVNRGQVIRVVSSIRGLEPTNETYFLSIKYIRQKASMVLFADLLSRPKSLSGVPSADLRITEALLMDGGIDPRVLLALLPPLRQEVVEGKAGIWIHAGLIDLFAACEKLEKRTIDLSRDSELLQLIKRYVTAWRQRKGFGSIADETEVFTSIDAALLRVLLTQDICATSAPFKLSSERQELYSFIDAGLDCFDRAVTILEEDNRLFTLSRLYQSRRMARKVLGTWQRIIEGEADNDHGLVDGENEIRKYLTHVRDHAIVDEYGTWLARRNPSIGVQVFTNEASKVKWEPHQVVMLLRRRAPDAVKDYLEHLVFGKKNVRYANDLISYYLDSVLTVLGSSVTAKEQLAQTYEVYRALRAPKPTYREYITENALPEPWWHDRLRLLELIGGSHGSDFSYNVQEVLSRIEPFEQDLVPESIILEGRQGRHKQALRLLTHGLGDFHTAVNYCLLGGASLFHPTQGMVQTPSRDEQSVLFNNLLAEFLRIEDVSDRLEQTSQLLARFSGWLDVRQVLDLIPEDWSVELVSGFLVTAFRRLVQERNECAIVKALSGAENLQVASEFVEKVRQSGPQVETEGS